ncbi:hypothetical protein DFH08DRAFT_996451 [Mycena albidolilacea]|uniref:Uncharacterized protein n=1 Tax=Mycena albidolilacea TaxID=1033008 RepID=A0AAD7E6U5_9AGAR|nr:hypothetical protein DFH08DRAFT_996451 [Mycena albidolilacea]
MEVPGCIMEVLGSSWWKWSRDGRMKPRRHSRQSENAWPNIKPLESQMGRWVRFQVVGGTWEPCLEIGFGDQDMKNNEDGNGQERGFSNKAAQIIQCLEQRKKLPWSSYMLRNPPNLGVHGNGIIDLEARADPGVVIAGLWLKSHVRKHIDTTCSAKNAHSEAGHVGDIGRLVMVTSHGWQRCCEGSGAGSVDGFHFRVPSLRRRAAARSWSHEGKTSLASTTVKCTGSYRIGWAHKFKLELPEALDKTKVRRRKEGHNLGRLQSSVDSVSDGDDSKESKVAQDNKNLATREHVGRTSSKSNPGPKNTYAVEYCLEEKRHKPNAVGRVKSWGHVESMELVLNRRERLMPSQSRGPPRYNILVVGLHVFAAPAPPLPVAPETSLLALAKTFPVSKYLYPPADTLPWPSLAIHLPLPFKHDASPPAAPRTRSTTGTQRSASISGPQHIIGASGLGGGTPGPVVVALVSAGEVVCEGDELVVGEGCPRHKDTEMHPRLCVVHAVVLTHLPIPLPFPFAYIRPHLCIRPTITPYPGPLPSRAPRIQGQALASLLLLVPYDTPDPQDPRHLWKNPWAEGRGRCRGECAAVHAVTSAVTWKWTQRRERYSHKRGKEGRCARWLQAGRMYGGSVPKQREQCGDEQCRAAWETSSPVGKCGESGEGEGSEVAVCRRRKGAMHARASRAQMRERAVGGLLTWKRARVEGAVWPWERGDA